MEIPKSPTPTTNRAIVIRPGNLNDTPKMGLIAATTYSNTPLESFLSPHRHLYPTDHIRTHSQKILARFLNPRNLSFLACPTSSPSTPIAHIQLIRLGSDPGAKLQISSRQSLWLTVLCWYYHVAFLIMNYIFPDRSAAIPVVGSHR
jgi:hypothetical protein